MRKIYWIILFILILTACKKSTNTPSNSSQTQTTSSIVNVEYRAYGNGDTIRAVYSNMAQGGIDIFDTLKAITYRSYSYHYTYDPFMGPSDLHLYLLNISHNQHTQTIKAEIYVNGVLKNSASGDNQVAMTNYSYGQ